MSVHSITLRSENPSLVVEFDLPPGTRARIGAAVGMNVCLPLSGLADHVCDIGRSSDGRIYTTPPDGQERRFIRLPGVVALPPYQFVVFEAEPAAVVAAVPAAAPASAPREKLGSRRSARRRGMSGPAIAGAAVAAIAIVGAFSFLLHQSGKKSAAALAQRPTVADTPAPAAPPEPVAAVAPAIAKTTPPPAGEKPAAAQPTPPSAAGPATPAALAKLDLETLVQRVSPAVFRLESYDSAGESVGTGTAFAISPEGLAVTNFHVIEPGEKFIARNQDDTVYEVLYVSAIDPGADLALIMLKGSGIPHLTLGESESLKIGAPLSVFGAPGGLSGSLSEGILSGRRTEAIIGNARMANQGRLLQMTAPISPGSSGSPVFDQSGKVVAVAAAILRGDHVQNLNLGIPVEAVNKLCNDSRLGVAQKFFPKPKARPKPVVPADPDEAALDDPDVIAMGRFLHDKNYSRAAELGRIMVIRYPKLAVAHLSLGNALYFSEKYFEAERVYRRGTVECPSEHLLFFGLGLALDRLGNPSDARAAYYRAGEISPDDKFVWKQIVYSHVVEQDIIPAIPALKQLRRLDRVNFEETLRLLRPEPGLGNRASKFERDSAKVVEYFDKLR